MDIFDPYVLCAITGRHGNVWQRGFVLCSRQHRYTWMPCVCENNWLLLNLMGIQTFLIKVVSFRIYSIHLSIDSLIHLWKFVKMGQGYRKCTFFFLSGSRETLASRTHSQGELALFRWRRLFGVTFATEGKLIWVSVWHLRFLLTKGEQRARALLFFFRDPNKQTDNGSDTFTAWLFLRWLVTGN